MTARIFGQSWWACFALALGFAASGCGSAPVAGEDAVSDRGVCPPDEPDCDRLDQPCVADGEPASTLGPGSSPMGLTTDLKANGNYRVWPKGRIPYKIDSSVGATTKSRLLTAMNEWETKTQGRVHFEKATSSDGTYLVVYGGTLPITNQVGYYPGTTSTVKLRNPEYITVIRHELGHVLGLVHEQRRSDRLKHIQVKTANIVNSTLCKSQFSVCTDCTLINGYDVQSIMQYRTSDLGNCRTGPVLLNLDGSAINHTWLIRTKDVKAIWELYGPPPSAPDAGGAAGAGGAGGAGGEAGSGATGGEAGSAAGAAGLAGDSSGVAGAAGNEGIDTADDPATTGASGTSNADANGGCSLGARGTTHRGWIFALALAWLLAVRRRSA